MSKLGCKLRLIFIEGLAEEGEITELGQKQSSCGKELASHVQLKREPETCSGLSEELLNGH